MYHNSWNTCAKIAVYCATFFGIAVSGTMLYPIYFIWFPIIYLLVFLMNVSINNDVYQKTTLVLLKLAIMIAALLINMACIWLIDKSSILPIALLQSLIAILYLICNWLAYAVIGEKV